MKVEVLRLVEYQEGHKEEDHLLAFEKGAGVDHVVEDPFKRVALEVG